MKNFISLFLVCVCLILSTPAFSQGPKDSYRLGGLFSLSGFGSHWGNAELNGATLALEEINQSGGIEGNSLSLVVEDTLSDMKATVTAFKSLTEQSKVIAVIGPNWAEFSEIVVPLALGQKIVTISPSGFKRSMFKEGSYFFSSWTPHELAVIPLAERIKKNDHKKVALLTSHNAFTEELDNALSSTLSGLGVSFERFTYPAEQQDFKTDIAKLRKGGFDAVVVFLIENGSLSTFLIQAKALQFTPVLYGGINVPYDPTFMANSRIAEGMTYYDMPKPEGEFAKKYIARFNEAPLAASATAYDSVFAVKEALKLCKGKDNLRACMLKVDVSGVSGHIAYQSDGSRKFEGVKGSVLLRVENGVISKIN